MVTLEIDPDGVAARDGSAFETRGKPEVACLVGKTWLSRETCAGRAKPGLVEAWVKAVR